MNDRAGADVKFYVPTGQIRIHLTSPYGGRMDTSLPIEHAKRLQVDLAEAIEEAEEHANEAKHLERLRVLAGFSEDFFGPSAAWAIRKIEATDA